MDKLKSYLSLARIDHWFKNIFMLPGVVFGILLSESFPQKIFLPLCVGFFSTCLIASANYIINEWLDRGFDRYHPTKKFRASVNDDLNPFIVYSEYAFAAIAGLFLAALLGEQFFIFSVLLLIMGLLYNVPPFRTKDRLYLDVLSESINNPIRFLLGWSIIEFNYLPPSSILFAYWMGGAFLMGIKRFAEYRFINDPVKAGLYRRSFRHYNESSLLISSFFYAISSAFFLGIFLIKYRIEYLLMLPLFSLLFAWYLKIGFSADSSAQNPEKLYEEKWFIAYVIFLSLVFILLSFVDLPWLNFLLNRSLVTWK